MENKNFGPASCYRLARRDSMNQTTIQRVVTCSGIGLHSGNKVYLALRPASANTGIIFDIHTPDGIRRVSPAPKAVATTVLATTLGSNGATVSTVEHLLASVLGLGIDNLIISVEGGEIPIMDGSAAAFLELFAEAGIHELPAPRKVMRISRPLELRDGDKYIRALPYAGFRVDCTIDFPHPTIGRERFSMEVTPENFTRVANAAPSASSRTSNTCIATASPAAALWKAWSCSTTTAS